jgi:hypothetical protein
MKTLLKGIKKGMKDFGHNLATIINTVLLFIVYIIGVGITAIIAKLAGKHFLDIKGEKPSYWSDLNLKKKPIEEYYRQF